jgi:small-conductance mechanosensitive channel
MARKTPLENAHEWIESGAWLGFGGRLLTAFAIVGIAYLIARLLRFGLDRLRARARVGAPLIYIIEQIASYAIIVVGVLAALTTIGLDLGSLTIFAGAVGVGLGLGLQGVVKEFVSGLVLIFDPAIQVGDFVELESGLRGEVVEIGARATRMRTNDDLNVVIPNSKLMQSQVVNWTYSDETRRIRVPFSVSGDADKALVRDVVLAAARALPFSLPDDHDRKTQVWLIGFGGDGMDFELIVWPTPQSSRHPAAMSAAYTWAIHEALRAAGIGAAAPQVELSVRGLFGREGDRAVSMLNLADQAPVQRRAAEPVPNDAASAVFDEEIRSDRARAESRTSRKRGEAAA